jgi:excisionase family DNA binding protein
MVFGLVKKWISGMEKLLTIHELSQITQFSRRTIYDWTHINFIPHYKFPKGIRFKLSEVENWLKKRKINGRISYKISIEGLP